MSVVLGADGGLDPARPFDAGGVAGGADGGFGGARAGEGLSGEGG